MPTAYGVSQARGLIGAVTAILHHSNSRSELCLWPTPQLRATPDPRWVRPRIKTLSSWIQVRLISAEPWWELHFVFFWYLRLIFPLIDFSSYILELYEILQHMCFSTWILVKSLRYVTHGRKDNPICKKNHIGYRRNVYVLATRRPNPINHLSYWL